MSGSALRGPTVVALILIVSGTQAQDEPAVHKTKPLQLTAGWGTIEGQFVLEGEIPVLKPVVPNPPGGGAPIPNESLLVDAKSRGIANIVIFLRKAPARIHPELRESKTATVDFSANAFCFAPRVLLVRTDQTVRCTSVDGRPYNLNVLPIINIARNSIVGRPIDERTIELDFPKPEPLPFQVRSDLHPWMQSSWVVTDHPYAAVTNAEGRFKIEGLPAGIHDFRVWHETAGSIEKQWTIVVPDQTTMTLPVRKVSAEVFKLEK